MAQQIRVCSLAELEDPGSLEFELAGRARSAAAFVVRIGPRLTAFINSCPHTGATLNWAPHQFLDYSGELIQCGLHGALFKPTDGLCIRGPCLGQALQQLDIELRGDQIHVIYE